MRRKIAGDAVIGIDLSLRRAAAVYLPPEWSPGEWKGVRWVVAGYPVEGKDPKKQTERLVHIANEIYTFAQQLPEAKVFAEEYAYGLAGRGGMMLAELGGAVKLVFGEDDIVVTPINAMTARKVLLGKIPQGKGAAQKAVHAVIQRMRPPWGEGSDEGDGWCIANAARSLLGLTAATVA